MSMVALFRSFCTMCRTNDRHTFACWHGLTNDLYRVLMRPTTIGAICSGACNGHHYCEHALQVDGLSGSMHVGT